MKRTLSIVGIITGIAFIVVGALSILGVLGGSISYPGSAPYYYDSGYASFGADYYTYSVNNTAEAASAARAAAYNAGDIAVFLTWFCGLVSVLVGLTVICGFGIVLSSCSETVAPISEDTPVASDAEELQREEPTSEE